LILPDNFMQDLKLRTDINDVISSYVTLKKRGRTYVGLCPFHNEKTPSFTVYPDTQSFYCFGCGAGGDAIGFIKKIENLDYMDAVKALAERSGMQIPSDVGYNDELAKLRRKVLEINRETAKFYHSYMMSDKGKVGLDYFLNRGLSLKTIKHFGLGYAPDSFYELVNHLRNQGFKDIEMVAAGVVKQGQKGCYDIFRNRVMTPIIDVRGNVIAFGGRVLDDSKPKYINTSDTLVYKKTNQLFALNFAKDSGKDSIILCEGYMDVIAMHQAGFTNAVAGCGTALTNEQVRLISRYSNEVILTYDADEAGQKALQKAISLFNQTDIKVRIPKLVGGKDPDEIIKIYGKEKFKGMLEGASNEIEFALLNAKNKYDLNSTQGKIDFINESIRILCNVSPIEQDLYVSRLSEELGVEKRNIQLQLSNYKKRNKRRTEKREYTKIVDESMRQMRKESYDQSVSTKQIRAQDRLIGLLLLYPNCYKYCNNFDSSKLSAGFIQKLYSMICKKLDDGLDVDIMDFSSDLSDEELGRLSGIIARSNNSVDPNREFKDCIATINDEYDKAQLKASDTSQMSDDDFRSLFNKNT
jgi:DNA primase